MSDYELLHMLSFDDNQNEFMQYINTDVEHKACEIKKQRGKAKIYKEYASFKDCETADVALKQVFAQHKWRKRHLKDSKEGKKRFYDCNTMGPRAQCPVRLYLLMHPDSCHTTVYISIDQHNHQTKFETDSEMMKLPEFVKKEILNLYENGTVFLLLALFLIICLFSLRTSITKNDFKLFRDEKISIKIHTIN